MNFEKQVILKNGSSVLLRFPELGDVDGLVKYLNNLSVEDTFVLVSGEVFTYDYEKKYLDEALARIAEKNKVQILAFLGSELIGNVEVNRMTKRRKRSLHVGEIAISVAKDFRGSGLGKILLKEIIEQGRNLDLRQLYLTTFAINERAQALYQKLGFIKVGEIPEHILYKGEYVGLTTMYLPLK